MKNSKHTIGNRTRDLQMSGATAYSHLVLLTRNRWR